MFVYVFQIHFHQRPTGIDEGILYGDPVRRMLPTVVHPNEILDGAIVRGFMGRHATTYAIQNHPVVRALYAQHAHTLWFGGVVLTVAQATEPERVRSACLAAGLVAHVLGADGALFTKEARQNNLASFPINVLGLTLGRPQSHKRSP